MAEPATHFGGGTMRRIIAIGKALVPAGWLITIILVGYGVSRQLKRTLFE